MKLILKEYLSSLKEREELDAILPDLLSQMGLNVYSRPGRGTRQNGVDVGAVGSLNGGPERVYLFTIKAGDLGRNSWDTGVQAVRPSLNEILDAYIQTRLPTEHRDKEIVICICCGGDILENVRQELKGFIDKNTAGKISFEEWNGDKLAELIQANLLREDLLPPDARSALRKSLAMLDEPDVSYEHFAALIRSLSAVDGKKDSERLRAIRQMGICLWILFSWARAGNMEAAYRAGELTLLYAWKVATYFMRPNVAAPDGVDAAFTSILMTQRQISIQYLVKVVFPHVEKLHGLSAAVHGSCGLDINLKLFDVLGRLGMEGLWTYWTAQKVPDDHKEMRQALDVTSEGVSKSIVAMIQNNPALLAPMKDDNAIDICIAILFLATDGRNLGYIRSWLFEIIKRSAFAYQTHGHYPCTLDGYSELLEHPKSRNNTYRQNVTQGSILYPLIALWAALFDLDDVFAEVGQFKTERLEHCTFQFWYPDSSSEEHIYTDSDSHGVVLTDINVTGTKENLLKQAFDECTHSPEFQELTAVARGFWPLVAVACRHYRLPLPLHLLEGLRKQGASEAAAASGKEVGETGEPAS